MTQLTSQAEINYLFFSGYVPQSYESAGKDLVPHGLSVTITAPEVFSFTAPACPDRHLKGTEALDCEFV